MRRIALVALACLGVQSCGELNTDYVNLIQPKKEVRAFDDIRASFAVATETASAPTVAIKRDALEKEFLLQPNVIAQEMIPMWNGLQSRIVAFRKQGSKLYMMQANNGHVVTDEIPQRLLLAEFDITRETADAIEFDFAGGMSRVLVAADWKASDFDGGFYSLNWDAAKVRTSYLESASIEASTHMVLTQVAQAEMEIFGSASLMPVVVKYYLSPYQPDPNFKPTESKSFEKMGFFEVAPRFDAAGKTKIFATKFDHAAPITFAVSSNTPETYRQAVKDGVLYWNKAFGKEIVKVTDAPDGLAGPDFNHNMVQWVTWDEAGFAYADAQMDPRSGQILHAQVYMTSVFAVAGRSRARAILRKINSSELKARRLGLANFGSARSCEFQMGEQFVQSLESLIATGASDEAILRASQDYVREVIAHEIGHTLGLRHNFAGSLAANYDMDKRDELFRSYLVDNELPADLVTTSSVMEYQLYEEGVFTGAKMAAGHDALAYDAAAIQHLYEGKEFTKAELPVFCTDTSNGAYVDCLVFDAGRSPVSWAFYQKKTGRSGLAASIAEQFIASKTPPVGEAVTVAATALSPTGLAARMAAPVLATRSFQEESQFLSIRRNYPAITELNSDQVRDAELAFVAEGFAGHGGVEKLFSPLADDFVAALTAEFGKLIRSEHYRSGVGYDGKPYSFDDNEVELMVAMVEKAAPMIKRKYDVMMATYLTSLTEAGRFEDHTLGTQAGDAIYQLAKRMLFATKDSKSIETEVELPELKKESEEEAEEEEGEESGEEATEEGGRTKKKSTDKKEAAKKVKVKLDLPNFAYSMEERMMAVSLLAPKFGEAIEWNLFNSKRLKDAYQELLKESLAGRDINAVKPEELTPEAAKWVLENKKVLGALTAAASSF